MLSSDHRSAYIKIIKVATVIWIGLIVLYYAFFYRDFIDKNQELELRRSPALVQEQSVSPPQYAKIWRHAIKVGPGQIKQQLLSLLAAPSVHLVKAHFGETQQHFLPVTLTIEASFVDALNFLLKLLQAQLIFKLSQLDWTHQRLTVQLNFLME